MSNRYEVREQIGKGGLGAVYKALDTQLQREVAIKRVLSTDQATEEEVKEAAAKLMAEAQTLSSLNHPNIVTVFDVGQDESGGFVVMELLKGETLDETVERGVFTQEDFTEVVYQTMEALIAAQANNVIHRDIKPTNIMLIWQASGKFQLKILDFGLAKFSRSPSVQTMDQEESVMGSIFFMAPEQFERGELDARTDLYQMGCVYYNALTGQYPFNGETAPQVMNAHLQHKVIPLDQVRPDLSPSICQWVMWMINRDIIHRPVDARNALKHWPRHPEPPGVKPVEALHVEATPQVATGDVTVVRAGVQASAPPALVVRADGTGSSPVAVRVVTDSNTPRRPGPNTPRRPPGPTTGPLQTGHTTGPLKTGTTTGSLQKAVTGKTGKARSQTGPLGGSGGGGRPNVRKTRSFKISKAQIIGLTSTIAVLLVYIGFNSWRKANAKEKEARIITLASTETPTGTPDDIALAVDFLSGDKYSPSIKIEASKVLARLEGSGISEKLHQELNHAESMTLRIQLSKALAERNYTPAVATMLDAFKSATTDDQRLQLLGSVRSLADLKSVDIILGSLAGDHTLPVRSVFEDTLLAVLRKGGVTEPVIDSMLAKVSTTSGNERKSLFRVLGVIGGDKVKKHLATIYSKKGDTDFQRDALLAYLNWQNRSVIGDVESLIKTTGDAALRAAAKRAYVRLATLPGPEALAELVPIWRKAFEMADNQNDVRMLIGPFGSLIEFPGPETLALLKEWENHTTHGPLAKNAALTLEKSMQYVVAVKAGEPLKGTQARIHGGNGAAINSSLSSLTGWVSPETWFSWNFKVAESGIFHVEVDQATLREDPSQFVIYLKGTIMKGQSKKTPTLDAFESVRLEGIINLEKDRIYTLILTAGETVQPRMMDIGAIRFVKQ